MRSHYCGQVNEKLVGQEVTVAGWVHRRRDHGGVIFADVRDREGLIQVVFDPDNKPQFGEAEKLRNEFVVKVRGLVRERPAGTANSTPRRTGCGPKALVTALMRRSFTTAPLWSAPARPADPAQRWEPPSPSGRAGGRTNGRGCSRAPQR